MALPSGPASRPRPKKAADDGAAPSGAAESGVYAAAPEPAPQAAAAPAQTSRPAQRRDTGRITGRVPSELFGRDALISPAVIGLSLRDFFELHYGESSDVLDQVTVEEFFRMREQAAWPDPFPAGDPRGLFTEDMCRRGLFVPIGWSADGLSLASCRDEAGQDAIIAAVDLLTGLPVHIYTITQDAVEGGIVWLYKRP